MSDWFELDQNRNAVPCAAGVYPRLDADGRRVGLDIVNGHRVSTVFLALDHQYGDGPPRLFETMIFEGESWSEIYCERYSTWVEAEAGHAKAVEHAKTLGVPA